MRTRLRTAAVLKRFEAVANSPLLGSPRTVCGIEPGWWLSPLPTKFKMMKDDSEEDFKIQCTPDTTVKGRRERGRVKRG